MRRPPSDPVLRPSTPSTPSAPSAPSAPAGGGTAGIADDTALLVRLSGGDEAAFEALVRRHQRSAYYLALRYVRDHEEAADVAQRAFVRLYQRRESLGEVVSFRAYLCKIVVNLALNAIRDRKAARADRDDEAIANAAAPAEADRLEQAEERTALREAVRGLPDKQRRTVELRIYEDLSFQEIADILGGSENAAKVNFHYALKSLRRTLNPGPAAAPCAGKGAA